MTSPANGLPATVEPPGRPARKTLGQRLLAPFADVRRDEVVSALLMTALMFLILASYYMLKTAREVFILSEGGAEVKSYSSAGQAVLLLGLVPAYGAFASRVNRIRLVRWVTLFFTSHILLFMAASRAGLPIGIVYFLWVGIFNVMVIAQFWAFANDLYTPEQGKRLFPLIGVGSNLGAWLGSVRAGQLMASMGPLRLLGGASGILVICALLPQLVQRVTIRRDGAEQPANSEERPLGREGGFQLIRQDRYLMFIAVLTLLLNVVNTTGEYLFGRYVVEQSIAVAGAGVEHAAERERFIGEAYSSLFSTVNLVGLLMQMFVVSRLFKVLGIGRSLFIHPMVAILGYLLMLRRPTLQLMNLVKIADNSLDYSLGNTTKQALWLPTSREAKYKAKQAVDSFFVRTGDVGSAALVFLGERLAFGVPAFASVNLLLAGGWLLVAGRLRATLQRRDL